MKTIVLSVISALCLLFVVSFFYSPPKVYAACSISVSPNAVRGDYNGKITISATNGCITNNELYAFCFYPKSQGDDGSGTEQCGLSASTAVGVPRELINAIGNTVQTTINICNGSITESSQSCQTSDPYFVVELCAAPDKNVDCSSSGLVGTEHVKLTQATTPEPQMNKNEQGECIIQTGKDWALKVNNLIVGQNYGFYFTDWCDGVLCPPQTWHTFKTFNATGTTETVPIPYTGGLDQVEKTGDRQVCVDGFGKQRRDDPGNCIDIKEQSQPVTQTNTCGTPPKPKPTPTIPLDQTDCVKKYNGYCFNANSSNQPPQSCHPLSVGDGSGGCSGPSGTTPICCLANQCVDQEGGQCDGISTVCCYGSVCSNGRCVSCIPLHQTGCGVDKGCCDSNAACSQVGSNPPTCEVQQCTPGQKCGADGTCSCNNETCYGGLCVQSSTIVNLVQPPKPPCGGTIGDNGGCPYVDTALGNWSTDPQGFVKMLFSILLSISGSIAILIIMFAGYRILTSQGDPEKIQGAKETITAAFVGLLFLIFSLVILQIIGVNILQLPGFGN